MCKNVCYFSVKAKLSSERAVGLLCISGAECNHVIRNLPRTPCYTYFFQIFGPKWFLGLSLEILWLLLTAYISGFSSIFFMSSPLEAVSLRRHEKYK